MLCSWWWFGRVNGLFCWNGCEFEGKKLPKKQQREGKDWTRYYRYTSDGSAIIRGRRRWRAREIRGWAWWAHFVVVYPRSGYTREDNAPWQMPFNSTIRNPNVLISCQKRRAAKLQLRPKLLSTLLPFNYWLCVSLLLVITLVRIRTVVIWKWKLVRVPAG